MPISKELFYAVLSMDAYNRGSGAAMVVEGDEVGAVRALNISGVAGSQAWSETGFHATVYDVIRGGITGLDASTIISYRGTNFPSSFLSGAAWSEFGKDIRYGWAVGAGIYGAGQAVQAEDLFKSVAGVTEISPSTGTSIGLTGHSLGGGLAGYISAFSGAKAIGYDHMPFFAASLLRGAVEAISKLIPYLTAEIAAGRMPTPEGVAALNIQLPTFRNFQGISLDGEILELIRGDLFVELVKGLLPFVLKERLQVSGIGIDFGHFDEIVESVLQVFANKVIEGSVEDPLKVLEAFIDKAVDGLNANPHQRVSAYDWDPSKWAGALADILSGVGDIASILSAIFAMIPGGQGYAATAALVDKFTKYAELAFNGLDRVLDGVAKHNMAALVLMKYADERKDKFPDWHRSWADLAELSDLALNSLLDTDIAEAASKNSRYVAQYGKDNLGIVIPNAVAYSVIDEGARPFGDTAAEAFFDDYDDLGKIVKRDKGSVNPIFTESLGGLQGLFDMLGGNPPLIESLARIASQYAGALAINKVRRDANTEVKPQEGVFALAEDESALAVDLSDVLWLDVLKTGEYQGSESLVIAEQTALFKSYFSKSSDTRGLLTVLLGMDSYSEAALDNLAKLGWEASSRKVIDRLHVAVGKDPEEITLAERSYKVEAAKGDETHVDVYIGHAGKETVHGTKGNDLLITEGGNDRIFARGGKDFVIAGEGDDIIVDSIRELAGPQDDGGDIYVGDNLKQNIFEGIADYLANLVGLDDQDTVRYSVADSVTGALAAKGLEVVSGELVTFEKRQALKLTIKDLNTGFVSSDILINIDVAELSERADTLYVDDATKRMPIVVDLSSKASGPVGKADFDTVDFSRSKTGAVSINGSVADNNAGPVSKLAELTRSVVVRLIAAAFQPDTGLAFRGAENIKLTDKSDVFFGGNLAEMMGVKQKFFGTPNHPGWGTITGGGGNDLMVYFGPGHRKVGELLDTSEPTGPTAGVELRLTLDGGQGNDDLLVIGGEKPIVTGGEGRDWIFAMSPGAELYGDTISGTLADGKTKVADDASNSDNFWWWPDTTIMDAQHHDVLKFFGLPLTGGNNIPTLAMGGLNMAFGDGGLGYRLFQNAVDPQTGKWDPTRQLYFDHFMPFMTYYFQKQKDGTVDLYIINQVTQLFGADLFKKHPDDPSTPFDESTILAGAMRVKAFDGLYSFSGAAQFGILGNSDLGLGFKVANPYYSILSMLPPTLMTWGMGQGAAMVDEVLTFAAAAIRFGKAALWFTGVDPLVFDLDGDGIETTEVGGTYFDIDGDMFRERTGWLDSDDGFLVLDANRNGRVDDISEMFGNAREGGFAELASHDRNGDGVISAADLVWSELRIWQDYDQDGLTDSGELATLEELGILSIGVSGTALGLRTPQGADLLSHGTFTRTDGTTGNSYEAIFQSDNVDTLYNGEAGRAAWQQGLSINAKGFGTVTDLAVAMANDIELGELVAAKAAAMTVPKLKLLREQSGEVLGKWGATLELTRELVAVKLATDAAGKTVLADRAEYREDAAGGYWVLASGAPILDAQGIAVSRATLEQVLAQGNGWRLEQGWSPSSRAAAVSHRDPAPYLVEIVGGRAVVKDYGIEQSDGSWRLASGKPVVDAGGQVIAAPTRADIEAQAHPTGQEWRIEQIGFNPYAAIKVEEIGVRFTDDKVVDYTVEVTDQDGKFYVWARNLDRALELQFKTGDSREFNLRNYQIDFEHLDEVGSTDDSVYRVELLTPAQFHFAMSLGGVDFRPEMLSATLDQATGKISYSVNTTGRISLSEDSYVSPIKPVIELTGIAMEQYVVVSRRFAVRMALQGGLKDFARGIVYDAATDKYRPTSDRELAPMFDAIFEAAPKTNAEDAAFDYLADWNEVLWQVYPDYALSGSGNMAGRTVSIDQAFIFQMLLPAFENVGVPLDIFQVANALSIDESRIITHAADATAVDGTEKTDFFYMSAGDQTFRGGGGADYYFVGKNAGSDHIDDKDLGGADELRFTDVKASDVKAIRDGEDLILEIKGRGRFIRLTDQVLGELNQYLSNGKQFESGVTSIVFSDGVVWDRTRMALEVVDKERAAGVFNDPLIGSGSGDFLWGGKGNDLMSGGAGGDVYIFARGDGQDVIDERGSFSFGPIKAGLDFLQFKGDISADDLKLTRDGPSPNLKITLLKVGQETSDTIEIVGQLGGITLGLGAFAELMGSSEGLDYVSPNLIERFIFEDGTSLEFTDIVERVLENARTDGDDAIYGLLNVNTLDGGKGNDYLTGAEGSDTYVFGRAYGKDVIEDNDFSFKAFSGPQHDTLKFIDDVRWTDLDFLRDGPSDTLTLRIKGSADQVTLREYLKELPFIGYVNLLEDIVFGDGTQWSYLKLLQHYVDIAKTGGDDIIYGFEGISDWIDGGAGNDRLVGQSGNDVYVYGRGYGNDTIYDSDGSERLIFDGIASSEVEFSRTALDLIITVRATGERVVLENQYVRDGAQHAAVEYFEFSDRTLLFTDFNPEDIDLVGTSAGETITGSNFAELLDGRGGDDTLEGGDGGDTYKFDVGYGHDVIVDRRIRASWQDRPGMKVPVDDVVKFGDDITRSNVVFTKDGNDLIVSVLQRTDTLRIRDQFRSTDDGVERFEFKDGTFLKISDVEELLQIEGGNRGDNVIEGTLDQPNTLDGRQGDDVLKGGNAGDTYAFSAGYGFDRIIEKTDRAGAIDKIVFGASVTRDALIVRRVADDLVIDLGNGVDVVTVVGGLAGTRIEEFHFADGVVLSFDQVIDRLLTGTAGDDQLTGLDGRNDTIAGGAGSDAVAGGLGNDTYKFGVGDGSDSISDSGGIDLIEFGTGLTRDQLRFQEVDGDLLITLVAGSDRLVVLGGYSQKPVESFRFADGTLLSIAEIRMLIHEQQPHGSQDRIDLRDLVPNAVVTAGTGHDRIIMANDGQLIFRRGDGIDRIEMPSGVTRATVTLQGFIAAEAVVRLSALDSNDLIVAFPATGDQIVLVGAAGGGAVPALAFDDGQTWDAAQLIQRSITDQAGPGDDIVLGSARDDVIAAGPGHDQVRGAGGNDVYTFARGDGRDVIDDSAGTDTLRVSGYRPDEMRVSRAAPGRNELVLTFGDGEDEIVLRYDANLVGVDAVEFGDGTRLSRDALFDLVTGSGSSGDDRLVGSARDETFTGGAGNDVVIGGGGNDVYRFAKGDGQDRIESSGTSDGRGVLEFGAGIA
ncbi:hypothetical protein E2493_09710, partial [Sphingomonas parva]